MKKALILLSFLLTVIFLVPPYFLGFSTLHLGHAIKVSTSLSAKLACSAHFVTGLKHQQIVEDLSSYSPVASVVELNYGTNSVTANLYGLATTTATYREGLGCTLDFDQQADLDTVKIKKLKASQSNWPEGESTEDIVPTVQSVIDNLVKQDNQQGLNTRALVVVKDGQLVAESYGIGFSAESQLLGWSMGKSLTAMMLGRMQQLEQASLSETNLLAEWQNTELAKLTLKQLLQMSSGLNFDETYAPGSDATHMLFTAPSASDVALKSELIHTPGSHFSYSSGTTNLLQRIIHQKLGNTLQNTLDFVQQQLYAPLNITSAIFEPDAAGILVGSSYIYASGRDWARLGQLMANKGKWAEQQILPESWVTQAAQPNTSGNEKAYGFQFWLNDGDNRLRWPDLPKDAYAMSGNRQQSVMIIPSENTVIVRLGWTKGSYPLSRNFKQILTSLSMKKGE